MLARGAAREDYYRREFVPPAYALLRARVLLEAQSRPWISWEQYLEVRLAPAAVPARARAVTAPTHAPKLPPTHPNPPTQPSLHALFPTLLCRAVATASCHAWAPARGLRPA